MKQTFTISGIAKATGFDRRTIQRALIDVTPEPDAGKQMLYDRDQVTAALAREGLDRDRIARLAPFGGSMYRVIAWNSYMALVKAIQLEIAATAPDWIKKHGVTRRQAELIGCESMLLVSLITDGVLARFDKYVPEADDVDEVMAGARLPSRNSKPEEFIDAIATAPEVLELMQAGLAHMKAAAAPTESRNQP